MFGKRRSRSTPSGTPSPAPTPSSTPQPTGLTEEQQRQELHARSEPIPTRPIRTVLVDVATDGQLGFWDAPLWLPIGGVVEGGDDLWEIVSVRLRLPTASADDGVRPVLYLYARKAEA
jgi:hypothetical protein